MSSTSSARVLDLPTSGHGFKPAQLVPLDGGASPLPAAKKVTKADDEESAAICKLLDAGSPYVRAEVTAAATMLRGLRARGLGFHDVAGLMSALAPLDARELAGARDHAFAVGKPVKEGEDADDRVGALMPEIDVDDLFGGAPVVSDMARHVAGDVVCARDLPALTILSLFSAACAGKVEGSARLGGQKAWRSPPNLYIAAEIPSGGKKSQTRRACGLDEFEARKVDVAGWYAALGKRHNGPIVVAKIELEQGKTTLKKLIKDGADRTTLDDLGARMAGLEEFVARKPPTNPTWMQDGSVTPQKMTRVGEVGGFVAWFPDEGKEPLVDKFVKEGNLAVLLSGFSGETCSNDTLKGDERGDVVLFPRPRVACFIPLQPGVLSPTNPVEAVALKAMHERGLFARLLVSRPCPIRASQIDGMRAAHKAQLGDGSAAQQVEGKYLNLLRAVLKANGDKAKTGEGSRERAEAEATAGSPHPLMPIKPWVFTFDDGACTALETFQAWAEKAGAEGGEHAGNAFVCRLADHAHRLATLLAVMRAGGIEGGGTVTADDVNRAVRFLKSYSIPHALAVAQRAIFDPVSDDSAVVLAKLQEVGEISLRLLRRNHFPRGWSKTPPDKVGRLERALDDLKARELIDLRRLPRNEVEIRILPQ